MDQPRLTDEEIRDLARQGCDDLNRLNARVYQLEKEMGLVANLVTIGALVGAYFLYQWYLQRLATIPGVATE